MRYPFYAEDGGAAMGAGEPVSGGDSSQAMGAEEPEQVVTGGGNPQEGTPPDDMITMSKEEFNRTIQNRIARVKREPGPGDAIIRELAEERGMTLEQLVEQIRQTRERQKQEAEAAKYRESGIDPRLIDERVNNHPVVKQAGEYLTRQQQEIQQREAFINEAADFLSFCEKSGIKPPPPDGMPPEVWQLKEESRLQGRDMSITEAFLRLKVPSLRTDAEQKVINDMKSSAQASPGSLGQGATAETKGFLNMSDDEFSKFAEEVEAGTKKIE